MKSKINFKFNKNIYILILVTLILFFVFISLNFLSYKIKSTNNNLNISSNINNEVKSQIIDAEENISEKFLTNSKITIPSISLYNAPIKEGIDDITLNEYIGHFPNTSNLDGNIGLAAHNRGYKNNYFKDINKLEIGNEIIYEVNNKKRVYKVETKIEIDSYDWSYLMPTNDNRLTLITCVANKPNRRLVVQAVE